MTSCFERFKLSMFCSLVRVLDAVALAPEAVVAVVVLADDTEFELAEDAVELWELFCRRSLASCSRFSCSRSFWICFCSISERLKTRLPPVSSARPWRFLSNSCLRRSIFEGSINLHFTEMGFVTLCCIFVPSGYGLWPTFNMDRSKSGQLTHSVNIPVHVASRATPLLT